MKRIRRLKNQPTDEHFETLPIYENTYVLGMNPNKPGGCVAGGLSKERGVKRTISFNLSRDEYFEKSGVNDAKRRLEWYMYHRGFTSLSNSLTSAKTTSSNVALQRLASFALVSNTLFTAYENGPSRSERWRVTIGKRRTLHRMARRVANLGIRDASEKDFQDIRIFRRKKRKGK